MPSTDGSAGPHSIDGTLPTQADVAKVRFFLSLLTAALVFGALLPISSKLLADPDVLWHIKTGLTVFSEGRLPTTDSFSHTQYGAPWVAKEWLSQLLLAATFSVAGWSGVTLLAACMLAFTALLLCWYLMQDLRPPVAAGITLCVMLLAAPTFFARPHVIALPLLVIWTAVLFKAVRAERPPPFWLLALLVLWANLHAGFTLAFVIVFFAFLDIFIRHRLRDRRLIFRWLLFAALCPLATLMTPYGASPLLATLNVAIDNTAVPFISEWQPLSFREDRLHVLFVMVIIFALLVTSFKANLSRGALSTLLLYMFLSYKRFIYAFAFPVPLVLSGDLAATYPRLGSARWVQSEWGSGEHWIARRIVPIIAVSGVALLVSALAYGRSSTVEPPRRIAVPEALEFVRQNQIEGRVFNSYGFGGVLIFNEIPTFVDGRTDQLFIGDFFRDLSASRTPTGFNAFKTILENYDVDWALLTRDDQHAGFLDIMPDWRRAYSDDVAVIYVRMPEGSSSR